jgi:hypothetical protein
VRPGRRTRFIGGLHVTQLVKGSGRRDRSTNTDNGYIPPQEVHWRVEASSGITLLLAARTLPVGIVAKVGVDIESIRPWAGVSR